MATLLQLGRGSSGARTAQRRRGSGEARTVAQREDLAGISQQSLLTGRMRGQKGVRDRKDSRVVLERSWRTGWTPVCRRHL